MWNVQLYHRSPTTLLAGSESSSCEAEAHFQPAYWFLMLWLRWGLITSLWITALNSHLIFLGPSDNSLELPCVLLMSSPYCLPAAHTRAWLWATQGKKPEQNLWACCLCGAFHSTLNCSVDRLWLCQSKKMSTFFYLLHTQVHIWTTSEQTAQLEYKPHLTAIASVALSAILSSLETQTACISKKH